MTRENFEMVLNRLRAYLGSQTEMALTGSNAFRVMGLLDFDDSQTDIDIVLINPSSETKSKVSALQDLYPGPLEITDNSYGELISQIEIEIQGKSIKIDFFQRPEDYRKCLTGLKFTGYHIPAIASIVAKKREYGRDKDAEDLKRLANLFYDSDNEWSDRIQKIFNIKTNKDDSK